MAAQLSLTTCSFNGTTYYITSASVNKQKDQIDVTALSDSTSRQYMESPLFQPREVTMEFLGYGPRAGAVGTLTVAGVNGGGTVTSSSTTFAVNEPVRSQATITVASS